MFKLKPFLIAEPLVNNWYAWCHLISPITLAMVTTNLHVPIMKSYLEMPLEHIKAANNPALRGGNFLNLSSADALNRVNYLLTSTQSSLAEFIIASNELHKFNKFLLKEANATSLEEFYSHVPSCLKGYIELNYDLNNVPQIRIIEPLLYKSSFYKPELQSIIFSETDPDKRAFSLSTPRFANDLSIQISKPFKDPFYDDFFKTKKQKTTLSNLKKIHSQHLDGVISFDRFLRFYEPAASIEDAKEKNAVEIKYFGHACVYINTGKVTILVDPFISYDKNIGDRYSFKDLPPMIDFVLITHAHLDHACLETLLQLRYKIKKIIVPKNLKGAIQDPSLKLFLNACGFYNVFEIDELDEIHFENGKIIGFPFMGEHGDLNIQSKILYLVNFNENNILFASDSNNIESKIYENIATFFPKIDAIFLGMESEGAPISWLYGSLILATMSKQARISRRLNGSNSAKAFNLINTFKCKKVFIYAMGLEPWISFISSLENSSDLKQVVESNKLIKLCQKNNILAERLYGKKDIIF